MHFAQITSKTVSVAMWGLGQISFQDKVNIAVGNKWCSVGCEQAMNMIIVALSVLNGDKFRTTARIDDASFPGKTLPVVVHTQPHHVSV